MSISTEEACRGVLALIDSPIAETHDFANVGVKIAELEGMMSLSSGEQKLVGIARSIWSGHGGAHIAALGELDRERCRCVLALLGSYWGDR